MIYCVDIRDYYSGNTIETILETKDHNIAYAKAKEWNENNGVTEDDVESFYNEDYLVHEDGHVCKRFADVYHDETR